MDAAGVPGWVYATRPDPEAMAVRRPRPRRQRRLRREVRLVEPLEHAAPRLVAQLVGRRARPRRGQRLQDLELDAPRPRHDGVAGQSRAARRG